MRGQAPLHEGHLAEAVRRGVITDTQREALLALARSDANPATGYVPDLRWTVVVQGVAAALAVLVPGFALLSQIMGQSELVLCLASLFAAMLFGALGWSARERGWGRVLASIFSAAVAPYVGGAVMFALDLGWWGVFGPRSFDFSLSGEMSFRDRDLAIAALLVLGSLVATVSAAILSRTRANGPVWSVVGVCVTPLVMGLGAGVFPSIHAVDSALYAIVVTSVVLGSVIAWWQRARLQRGGVDGAAWFELGLFAPAGLAMIMRLTHHTYELGEWLALAAIVAVAGVRTRRWTYQLAGALGLLLATIVGLRRESAAVSGGAVVGVAALIAFAAQSMRAREAERALHEPASEPLSFWE